MVIPINVEEDDEDGADSPLVGLMMAAMMMKMFTMWIILKIMCK